MQHITFIGTIHSDNGQCNFDELHKILEDLKPEVIFDELPSHFADLFYNDSFDIACADNILNKQPILNLPLEVKCILKYRLNHTIKIVPIDIDVNQDLEDQKKEILFLFNIFFKNDDYINIVNKIDELIQKEGFNFINSNKFLELLEKKELLEREIIGSESQKHRLLTTYSSHRNQINNRENIMLNNIYKYSKENQYNKAVFLLGAEHKKSIMQKISDYEKLSENKLNWKMYGDN